LLSLWEVGWIDLKHMLARKKDSDELLRKFDVSFPGLEIIREEYGGFSRELAYFFQGGRFDRAIGFGWHTDLRWRK